MDGKLKLLDVVALLNDIPEHSLRRGNVGTIVQVFKDGAFDVEFCDDQGRAYALLPLTADQLLPLYFHPFAQDESHT